MSEKTEQETLTEEIIDLNPLRSGRTRLDTLELRNHTKDDGYQGKDNSEEGLRQDTSRQLDELVDVLVRLQEPEPLILVNQRVDLGKRGREGHRETPEDDHTDHKGTGEGHTCPLHPP